MCVHVIDNLFQMQEIYTYMYVISKKILQNCLSVLGDNFAQENPRYFIQFYNNRNKILILWKYFGIYISTSCANNFFSLTVSLGIINFIYTNKSTILNNLYLSLFICKVLSKFDL